MNKAILMGRLTRDPDIRYTNGDNSMCIAHYTLAVDRRFSRNNPDGQTADFINCVAFGKSGEFAERYFHKGIKIAVVGRIQTGSYTNRDGVKVYTTEVIVEDQEFAESKNASSSSNYNGNGGYGRDNNNYGGGYNDNGSRYSRSNNDYGGSSRQGEGSGSQNSQNNSGSQNADSIDGFMNIPDGIDEELPFA